MDGERTLVFKVAAEREELDQVHALNYRTFVEEIPQHAPNEEQKLVDKFHADNTYIVCKRGDRVIGMVAMRETRPFSLDGKIDDLDLGYYAAKDGVPFTHSSNLLYALRSAVKRLAGGDSFGELADLSARLRTSLRDMGFRLVGAEGQASPAVITLALPETMSSEEVGSQLEDAGFLLSYRSSYLLERNWIQICLMGDTHSWETIQPLLNTLPRVDGSVD